ncbi:MAG: D-hexose-6-phosphate mutarotase [Methylococcales bacterium]
MDLTRLNDQYGIPGQLKFTQRSNGFVLIEIENNFAQATISTYGGQVLSFKPVKESDDLLFVSKLARFEPGKAIRGGIPICWPWFGPDPQSNDGPAHGLVRTRQWKICHAALASDGAIKVILSIHDSAETRKIWSHSFELSIIITIRESLTMELITRNTASTPFTVTQALHAYFKIEDCQRVQISGLENTTYLDKTDAGKQKSQHGPVTISQEVDRIYTSARSDLVLEDAALSRNIRIHSKNSQTTIVWNPWKKKAAAMSDLDDNEFNTMLCLETANAGADSIIVSGNSEYSLEAQYQIVRTIAM